MRASRRSADAEAAPRRTLSEIFAEQQSTGPAAPSRLDAVGIPADSPPGKLDLSHYEHTIGDRLLIDDIHTDPESEEARASRRTPATATPPVEDEYLLRLQELKARIETLREVKAIAEWYSDKAGGDPLRALLYAQCEVILLLRARQ